MEKQQEIRNSKTRSIARRINFSVWLDKLKSFIVLDITVVVASLVLFVYMGISAGTDVWSGTSHAEVVGDSLRDLALEITEEDGDLIILSAADWMPTVWPILLSMFVIEGLDLLGTLSNTYRIRRKLRPLEELAMRASAISRIPVGNERFENLEQAILEADTNGDDAPIISTGDEDLKSIENALNGLLRRQQESYRQQVRFVSDASHELRTPIAVIQGYANMLDRWGKDDPSILQEGITSIRNESEHMRELVEQLLFLARSDSGRNVLQKKPFDMKTLVREVCDESAMIDEKHCYVLDDASQEGDWTAMVGDPGMIKQSMRIFLQNAEKYTEPGGTIRLALEVRKNGEGKTGWIGYSITDEGIGIAEEDIGHIFERFYRSDKARNSKTGGSGLGLSVARWIVDAHGGKIDVVSRQDFGTRFTVLFPQG